MKNESVRVFISLLFLYDGRMAIRGFIILAVSFCVAVEPALAADISRLTRTDQVSVAAYKYLIKRREFGLEELDKKYRSLFPNDPENKVQTPVCLSNRGILFLMPKVPIQAGPVIAARVVAAVRADGHQAVSASDCIFVPRGRGLRLKLKSKDQSASLISVRVSEIPKSTDYAVWAGYWSGMGSCETLRLRVARGRTGYEVVPGSEQKLMVC